jgi:hypothetical protein
VDIRMSIHKKAVALVFIALFVAPLISYAVLIEGRVFTSSGPMEGAKVYAYRSYADISLNKPFLVSEPADADGIYKFQLPQGEYYLTARADKDGREFFAFHGNNPFAIRTENLWITMMVTEVRPPVYSHGNDSVKGTVTYKGEAIKGGLISFYSPSNRSFRGMGVKTDKVMSDGTFNVALLPGKYVVIAKKTEGDNKIRPLKKGDLFCYYGQNPVEVKANDVITLEIECYPKGDRSSFVSAPVIKANDFLTTEDFINTFRYGIQGKVTDAKGMPVEGIYVAVYMDAKDLSVSVLQGNRNMQYSSRTDKDGNYFISIDSDGTFTIVARNTIGKPGEGYLYGVYGGSEIRSISYKKGQMIENVDITVRGIDFKKP